MDDVSASHANSCMTLKWKYQPLRTFSSAAKLVSPEHAIMLATRSISTDCAEMFGVAERMICWIFLLFCIEREFDVFQTLSVFHLHLNIGDSLLTLLVHGELLKSVLITLSHCLLSYWVVKLKTFPAIRLNSIFVDEFFRSLVRRDCLRRSTVHKKSQIQYQLQNITCADCSRALKEISQFSWINVIKQCRTWWKLSQTVLSLLANRLCIFAVKKMHEIATKTSENSSPWLKMENFVKVEQEKTEIRLSIWFEREKSQQWALWIEITEKLWVKRDKKSKWGGTVTAAEEVCVCLCLTETPYKNSNISRIYALAYWWAQPVAKKTQTLFVSPQQLCLKVVKLKFVISSNLSESSFQSLKKEVSKV